MASNETCIESQLIQFYLCQTCLKPLSHFTGLAKWMEAEQSLHWWNQLMCVFYCLTFGVSVLHPYMCVYGWRVVFENMISKLNICTANSSCCCCFCAYRVLERNFQIFTYICVYMNWNTILYISPTQPYNKWLSKLLCILQLASTSEITTYTDIYYHGMCPQ